MNAILIKGYRAHPVISTACKGFGFIQCINAISDFSKCRNDSKMLMESTEYEKMAIQNKSPDDGRGFCYTYGSVSFGRFPGLLCL